MELRNIRVQKGQYKSHQAAIRKRPEDQKDALEAGV